MGMVANSRDQRDGTNDSTQELSASVTTRIACPDRVPSFYDQEQRPASHTLLSSHNLPTSKLIPVDPRDSSPGIKRKNVAAFATESKTTSTSGETYR
jgi:hypothetical protein